MNQETESKPVPRAERYHDIDTPADAWAIVTRSNTTHIVSESSMNQSVPRHLQPEHDLWKALIESAKLREELQRERNATNGAVCQTLSELLANGNRVAAELGLPEDSGVDEVIVKARSLKECNSDGWDRVTKLEASLRHEQGEFYVFRNRLRRELGMQEQPGISDAVMWTSFAKRLAGPTEALQQIAHLGTFIGHPGATPAHVVSETVSLIEKLQASEMNCADLVANLRSLCDDSMAADREQILENVRAWKQRALAAEARLTGGPDAGVIQKPVGFTFGGGLSPVHVVLPEGFRKFKITPVE